MSETPDPKPAGPTRRQFLSQSGTALAGASALSALHSRVYAAEDSLLRVGLIGCGGRGTGAAAQALTADPNTRLVAMCDAFEDRLAYSLKTLKSQPIKEQVEVAPDQQFTGFDGYLGVIDACDVVLLATPPHFRPAQLRAAIEAGKHCFVEKPIAVDAPGVRSVEESCKMAAEKGLSVVSGLCWRYHAGMKGTFEQLQEGLIGDITSIQVSYNTRGLWHRGQDPAWSDLEYQARNWLYFNWLSGDHIAEQHIHSLDKMAWAMGDVPPLKATGTGGRETRTEEKYGNIYDHFAIVYEYADGVKGFGRCRQQNGCDVDVSDHILGTKGRIDVMKHTAFDWKGKPIWRFRGNKGNMYQAEHDALFAAIRSGEPINNGDYMTKSTMIAVLGRMAGYTGRDITWEQAYNSDEVLGPDNYDNGDFEPQPIPKPGVTQPPAKPNKA